MEITKTEQKYLDFLKDLHFILQETDRISMAQFSKKRKINRNVTSIMVKKGIIKKTGNKNKCLYEWDTINPNIHMVRKLLHEISIINVEAKEKRDRNNQKQPDKTKENFVIQEDNLYLQFITMPILFGLTKIKINLHYGKPTKQLPNKAERS